MEVVQQLSIKDSSHLLLLGIIIIFLILEKYF